MVHQFGSGQLLGAHTSVVEAFLLRLFKLAVKESLIVLSPGGLSELEPGQLIWQVFVGASISDFNGLPI